MTLAVAEHVPLGPRTTLGVGGDARFYVEAHRDTEVVEALRWARDRGVRVEVIGGGSNLLVADGGVDALVVRPRLTDLRFEEQGATVELEVGAGVAWDDVVAASVARDLAGLECLSGIPGDTGATPIQNVGAYGQEVAETLARVLVVERTTGELRWIEAADCGFAYRDSVFKRGSKDRFVIARVVFRLRRGGAPTLRYAELERALAEATAPSLAEVRRTVLDLRRSKSMLLDPNDENGRSAGSFFTNPLLDAGELARALERIEAAGVLSPGERVPRFAAEDGKTKLAAGWLIERAGFAKGTRDGRVGLSTRHALAIVNRGGATAAEIVAFAGRIQAAVSERFGVALRPEPVLLGFDFSSGAG